MPNEPLVPGDVMLAQKIGLETDEWAALAVAKSFSSLLKKVFRVVREQH